MKKNIRKMLDKMETKAIRVEFNETTPTPPLSGKLVESNNYTLKYIRKEYSSLKQAERYLNRLYNKYEHVRLVICPLFSGKGVYIYEVK